MQLPQGDHEQILQLLASSTDGWNRGELKAHLAIYEESFTQMTRSGPRAGLAQMESAFREKYFKSGAPQQQLRSEEVVIRALGLDAALMTGRYVLAGGSAPESSGWFTLIWRRTTAGWRVVHDHSS